MKDFRSQVVRRAIATTDVAELLQKGQLRKALGHARAAGVVVSQEEIDATARAMFRAGRASELVAMIGTLDVMLPYNTSELLLRAFEVGDYHGFLKQVHRLGVEAGFESTIQQAIAGVERTAPREAGDWRRKFSTK